MAKKVSENRVTRFEYKVINDKFYLEIEETIDTFRGEKVPYYRCYLQHGTCGVKRFCYGRPQTDMLTGNPVTVLDVVKSVETFLLHSITTYMEEQEVIDNYYASKSCDCDD